jgi:hypothetical protein
MLTKIDNKNINIFLDLMAIAIVLKPGLTGRPGAGTGPG